MRPLGMAVFVFLFMLFIAVQTYTGFVYRALDGARPKAVVAMDGLVHWLFVSRIGMLPTVAALLALGALFAVLAYRRAAAASG